MIYNLDLFDLLIISIYLYIYLISHCCFFIDASYINEVSRQYSGTMDNSKCHINEKV